MKDIFDFKNWINIAFLDVVKKALLTLEKNETKLGKHSFYITFSTEHPSVKIPQFLKDKYPEAMSIILEHEFKNLKNTKTGFSVSLSFNSNPEDIFVPFDSILFFMDNSINLNIGLEPNLPSTKKEKTSSKLNTVDNNIIEFPCK